MCFETFCLPKECYSLSKLIYFSFLEIHCNIIVLEALSHMKHLANIWPDPQTHISSMIKPNATLNKVVKDSKQLTNNFPKKDNPVIMGSSNRNLSSINTIKRDINVFFKCLIYLDFSLNQLFLHSLSILRRI